LFSEFSFLAAIAFLIIAFAGFSFVLITISGKDKFSSDKVMFLIKGN